MSRALIALRGVYETVTWNEERMQTAADGPAAAAIDLAEMLVEQGMPFRQAHALVGGLVRDSLERHVPLVELVAAHPALGEAAVGAARARCGGDPPADPGWRRSGPGGDQVERFVRRREVDRTRLAQWRRAGAVDLDATPPVVGGGGADVGTCRRRLGVSSNTPMSGNP